MATSKEAAGAALKTPAKDVPKDSAKSSAAPDWERIEFDYRAGIKSLREIAEGSGVSHVSISKRAKKAGWVRDLGAKIHQKANELVNKALVNSTGNTVNPVTERDTIDANAQAIATVRLTHRKDITRTRSITMAMLSELEKQTDPRTLELLEDLGEMLRKEDDNGQDRLNDVYLRIISLPERAKTMKALGESLRTMIVLERQAFDLDKEDKTDDDPLSVLLHGIAKRNHSSFQPVADDPEHLLDEED